MEDFDMSNIGVYAGSFNPFTNGHLSVVKDACKLFDKVYICIASNSEKSDPIKDNMAKAITEVIVDEKLNNCEVFVLYDSMVADFCAEVGASYLIRALRNTSDYLYEENIAKVNYEVNPNLTTIYLRSKPEVEAISSSMVRELYKYGKDISKYLPVAVAKLYLKSE